MAFHRIYILISTREHSYGVNLWFQAENVILELNKTFPEDGLLPIYINPHRGTKSHATITFGAMGDRYNMIPCLLFIIHNISLVYGF